MPASKSSTSPMPGRCLGAASGSSGAGHGEHLAHLGLVAAEGAADRQAVDPADETASADSRRRSS